MTIQILIADLRLIAESNRSEHWAEKAKRVKAERKAVADAFARSGQAPINYAEGLLASGTRVRVTITRIAPRRLEDSDNLASACKHVRDEIARALGLKSDSDRGNGGAIEWACDERKSDRPRKYATEISVGPC